MQSKAQVKRHCFRKGALNPRVDWSVKSGDNGTRVTQCFPNGERFTVSTPASTGENVTMYRMERGLRVCNTLILRINLPSHSKRRRGILARVNTILRLTVPIQHPQCPDNLGNGEFHLVLRDNGMLTSLLALQDKNCDVCTLREKF